MNVTLTDNNDKILHTAGKYCKEDITLINKVPSLDTSDATAVAQDLIINKTAYVNGEKITGTRVFKRAFHTKGYHLASSGEGNIFGATLREQTPCFTNDVVDISVAISDTEIAESYGITAEKIAEGNTIAGVIGVAKLGDANIYETIEELQTITGEADDVAIVYQQAQNVAPGITFSKVIFPKTVIVPTAVSEEESYFIDLMDENGVLARNFSTFDRYFFDCNLTYRTASGESKDLLLTYESEDGITYQNTSEIYEYDFECNMQFNPDGEWHDNMGYFIQIGETNFQGVYQYNNEWIRLDYVPALPAYELLSGNNYTIKFAENPIEFLTTSKNVTDLVEGTTISITGHYKGAGSPDAAIANYFRKDTNEVVRHKDANGVMTYYAYFSDETLPFATALTDTSAYTTAGYYTIDYTTMSIVERVGSTLTLNFTYEMNSIRAMYQIVDGVRKWIDITTDNEEQWKANFKDLIEDIYTYEETIEVQNLKADLATAEARIAELEAEIAEANTLIDQLNGEEV